MIELRKATAEATRYACLHFHYAKAVPSAQYSYNVYENGEWCGVIVFGSGATINIATMFGLVQGEVLELVRVALNGKQNTTSECVAAALKRLHADAPAVRIVVSYADPNQGHVGTIYQATNWLYIGDTAKFSVGPKPDFFIIHGEKMHPRTVYSHGWKQSVEWLREHVDPNADSIKGKPKLKYIYCFDKKLRKQWAGKALPYPKQDGD
jgi:hypothetical protein